MCEEGGRVGAERKGARIEVGAINQDRTIGDKSGGRAVTLS